MPLNTRNYSDIDLNFIAHPLTGDITPLQGQASVIQALKTLILTEYFERPFHSEVGSPVSGLLFDNITPLTATYVKQSILNVIQNFEPRVSVQSVVVNTNPDYHTLSATITFFINNLSTPVSFSMMLERLR